MESMEELYARFGEARDYKDRWLALYKNLYFYVIPDRDAFNVKFNYRDDGKPVTQQIYDNTAVLAAYQRSNDLHGLLLPKDRTWGKFALDPHFYDEGLIKQLQPLMEEMNERIFFYINQSNLARVISASNLDLVGGTGVIWVESQSDEVPLYFRSIPAVATYIEYSTDDLVTTCWYACKMTGRQVLKEFPDYNGKQLKPLTDNPNDTVTVNYGQIQLAEDKFYIYCVLDSDPFTLLHEKESTYQQIIIYRDRVRPGECEGRGIGLDLMPNIMDLNRIVEYNRKSMAYKAYPTMFYDTGGYFNPYSIRQWAGAMIARNPQARDPISTLQMPEYHGVLEEVQALQNMIRTGFQVDPLGEVDSPVKTATEISVRENRAQRTSATDISRLINEQPGQVYKVCATILNSRGLLIKKRQEIPGFSTKRLRFDYQSPLYDIQNKEDLNNLAGNLQFKQQFIGEGAVLASTNLGELSDFLTKKYNLPSKLFKSGDELNKIMHAMAKLQQQQGMQGEQPSPTTTAGQVSFPEQQGVTI